MKLRRVSLLVVFALIVCLGVATSASAAPPKETWRATWVHGAWDPLEPGCASVTGNAYHEHGIDLCGRLYFDLTACSNDKVCGTYEFWEHSYNQSPQSAGMQFVGRIDVSPTAYWELSGASDKRHDYANEVPFYQTIAHFEGRGHGDLEGWLIKGTHWYEPGGPPPFGPDGPSWGWSAVFGGEIIHTGKP